MMLELMASDLKNYMGCCAKGFEIMGREKPARTRVK
jgi:hypothetical protein